MKYGDIIQFDPINWSFSCVTRTNQAPRITW